MGSELKLERETGSAAPTTNQVAEIKYRLRSRQPKTLCNSAT